MAPRRRRPMILRALLLLLVAAGACLSISLSLRVHWAFGVDDGEGTATGRVRPAAAAAAADGLLRNARASSSNSNSNRPLALTAVDCPSANLGLTEGTGAFVSTSLGGPGTTTTSTSTATSSRPNSNTDPQFRMNVHDPAEDCPISSDIVRHGCYECHVLRALLDALRNSPPETVLIDLGGNIGQYALGAAAMGRSSYVFEPVRRNWERICRSVNANDNLGLGRRLTLFDAAVADVAMVVGLEDPGRNRGAWTLNRTGTKGDFDFDFDGESDSGGEGVLYARAVALDDIRDVLPRNVPVVLKVDVEGEECNAIGGALKYLTDDVVRIEYAAVEWSQARLRKCRQRDAIFDLFQRNGLIPYRATMNGPKPSGWTRLDVGNWRSWTWGSRYSPLIGLFDVAWSRTEPALHDEVNVTQRC
mmetsp:Transcript_6607/g.13953  ORF Transcript_6607/g.13953 Transcript_6607/m.13953 type:complete len:417 (+) Transcript_6607:323-1573(+)